MLIALMIILSGIFLMLTAIGDFIAFKRYRIFDIYNLRLYKIYPIWDVEVAVLPPQTVSQRAVAAKVAAAPVAATE